jgi:DNA-directed RNA polymerase subunit H (RpoH/RPB5)
MNQFCAEFRVYENLFRYLDIIGYAPEGDRQEKKEFLKSMQFHGYVSITAKQDKKSIRLVVIDGTSDISRRTVLFKGMLNANKGPYIIVVTALPVGSQIKKLMATKFKTVKFKNFLFKHFKKSPRDNAFVPLHTLCTDAEMATIMEDNCITDTDQFPRILHSDPQVMWIGGEPGQLVKIDRVTDVGPEQYYRFIV